MRSDGRARTVRMGGGDGIRNSGIDRSDRIILLILSISTIQSLAHTQECYRITGPILYDRIITNRFGKLFTFSYLHAPSPGLKSKAILLSNARSLHFEAPTTQKSLNQAVVELLRDGRTAEAERIVMKSCERIIADFQNITLAGGISSVCPKLDTFTIGSYLGRKDDFFSKLPMEYVPDHEIIRKYGSVLDSVYVPLMCMTTPLSVPFKFTRSTPIIPIDRKLAKQEELYVHIPTISPIPTTPTMYSNANSWPIMINGKTILLFPLTPTPVYLPALFGPILESARRVVGMVTSERARVAKNSFVNVEIIIPRATIGDLGMVARTDAIEYALKGAKAKIEGYYDIYGASEKSRKLDKWTFIVADGDTECPACLCKQ